MKASRRRILADLVCRVLQAIVPASLRPWGWAIRCETTGIKDDTRALLFALDSLRGLLPQAVVTHLLHCVASLTDHAAPFGGGSITMSIHDHMMRRPRAVGIACAVGGVALGLVYMAIAGAPGLYLGMNVGALMVGLAALALLGRLNIDGRYWQGGAFLVTAAALLATALFGTKVDGAARWVHLGGLSIQPSLILLPVMLVAFAQNRNALMTAGMMAAIMAMALQPDRAMAGMAALGLTTLAMRRPDRHTIPACLGGVAGLALTLARADTLPAAPYVEQIFYTSFATNAVAGMAVVGGAALLLVPAIVGWLHDPASRATHAVFGAVWGAAILAAALGNYPTPVVGYGGSAIIGYALCLLTLPRVASTGIGVQHHRRYREENMPIDGDLRVGMA